MFNHKKRLPLLLSLIALSIVIYSYAMENDRSSQEASTFFTLLSSEQCKKLTRLVDHEILLDEIQNKIAQDMVIDFLLSPKIFKEAIPSDFSVAINGEKLSIGICDDTLNFYNEYVLTKSTDHTIRMWIVYNRLLTLMPTGCPDAIKTIGISTDSQKVITISSDNGSQLWQLQLDFTTHEFINSEHPLFWIKQFILPYQANLIARAVTETQKKNDFVIKSTIDDAITWVTFPTHIRDYIMERLKIRLTQ